MKASRLPLAAALLPALILPATLRAATETVDGIEWTYTVTDGGASIDTIPTSTSGTITIPATLGGYPVTSIGYGAFSGCSGLTSVTIPNSVTSIGAYAFYYCRDLTSVTIPDSVTSIGNWAFNWCANLTSVTIGEGVTSIGGSVFACCDSLTLIAVDARNSVYDSRGNCNAIIRTADNTLVAGCRDTAIPDSVTSIGRNAFRESGFTSVTIPNSVTNIEGNAFYWSSLTSLTIPASVISIDRDAFCGCDALETITVENANPVYDSRDNCNAIIRTADNVLVAGCQNTTIPNSVTSIEAAFDECTTLTSVTIPHSVTNIGDYAFYDCFGLTSMTIPGSVTRIGVQAFRYCKNLISVTIPNSVTSIGERAFEMCSGLKSMVIPNSVTSIGEDAFQDYGTGGLKHLYLPASFEGRTGNLGIPEGCTVHFGVTPSIPSLTADTTPEAVTNAIESANFADDVGVMATIGGSATNYLAFKMWAQGVAGGEAAVVASPHAAVSYLLGAEALFANEPKIRIASLALEDAQGTGNRERGTGSAMSVTVVVKDGEEIARVDAAKVAEMFEATGDLGDWDGTAKLTPSVTNATRKQDGTMTFTVIPGNGTRTSAFLRIRVVLP